MLSGIQQKLIDRFKEYYKVDYDVCTLLPNDTVRFDTGENVLIVEYNGLVIYDTKRGIDIRKNQ